MICALSSTVLVMWNWKKKHAVHVMWTRLPNSSLLSLLVIMLEVILVGQTSYNSLQLLWMRKPHPERWLRWTWGQAAENEHLIKNDLILNYWLGILQNQVRSWNTRILVIFCRRTNPHSCKICPELLDLSCCTYGKKL